MLLPIYLHSIMFLLFRKTDCRKSLLWKFTFHYVSIISMDEYLSVAGFLKFTFHYVSIISKSTS